MLISYGREESVAVIRCISDQLIQLLRYHPLGVYS